MSDNEENQQQTIDSDAQNTTCPYIKDAVRLENIEEPIEKLNSNLQCETCSGGNTKETDNLSMKTSNSSGSEHTLVDDLSPNTEPDPISARSLFLCLSCGQLNCGREDSKHALAHYNENKEHCIVIDIKTLDTWCYACDDNLPNLTEDQSQTIDKVQSLIRKASESKDTEIEETPNELIKKSIKNKYRITAPGLQNLGNTCFFNSLMQVVAATSVLHDILDPSNPYYDPPLVSYKKCPAATNKNVGPLTDNFKSFLDMMWKQHDGTVNPKNLFQEISRKWQQFRGWRQQDSQEVMRYLFDGIKSEEFELIKKLSADKKDDIVMEDGEVGEEDNDDNDDDDDDDNDDNDDDVEVDEISSQGSINQKEKDKSSAQKYESFIDACFGGKLVSVIVCDTCDNCSYSYEEFLDVSLPIKSPNQTESQKYTNESATYYSTYDIRYGSRDDNSSPHSSGGDADIGDDGDAIAESDDNDGQQKKFDDETKPSAKSIKRKKRNKLLLRESHSNNNNNNKNIYNDNNNGNSFSYSSYSYNYFSSSSIKENDISLIDCLNSFMRVETLEGDNAFACGNCWQIKEKREKKLKQQKLQERQKQQQEIEDADVIDNGEEHREMIEEQVNKNSNDDDDDNKNDDFNNDDVVVVNNNNDNNYNKVEETDDMIISRTTPDNNTYEPNDAEDSLNHGGNNDYNGGDGTVNGDDEVEESDDKMIISQTASNDAENPLNHDDNDSNNNSCNVVNSRSADNNNGYSTLNSNSDNNNDHSSGGDNNSNDDYSINDCSMFNASSNNNSNNSSSTYNTPLPPSSSDTSNHDEMIISTESSSSSLMERERERERERTTEREKSRSQSPPKREKFKLQKAYKRYLFASLPPVLVFHLKRFQQVGSRWSMHMKKIDDFVSFEEEIDVGEFVVPPEIEEDEEEESDGTDADDDSNNNYKRYKADEISNDDQVEEDDAKDLKKQQQQNKLIEKPSQSTKYRLYGVVVHLGSLFNGHYIAFVLSRNIVGEGEQTGLPNLSYDDRRTVNEIHKQAVKTGNGHRQWIYCSDSSVRSATVEEALSSGAYLLFYERVNE